MLSSFSEGWEGIVERFQAEPVLNRKEIDKTTVHNWYFNGIIVKYRAIPGAGKCPNRMGKFK
jgi:hypothetical protein